MIYMPVRTEAQIHEAIVANTDLIDALHSAVERTLAAEEPADSTEPRPSRDRGSA